MNWTNTRNEGGVWKLHDEVSSAAFESMEALWSAFLEAGDLDMVRSSYIIPEALVGCLSSACKCRFYQRSAEYPVSRSVVPDHRPFDRSIPLFAA